VLDWLGLVQTCIFSQSSESSASPQLQATPFKNVTSVAVRKLRCDSQPPSDSPNRDSQANVQLYLLREDRLFVYSFANNKGGLL
jgi:hypothetical protein